MRFVSKYPSLTVKYIPERCRLDEDKLDIEVDMPEFASLNLKLPSALKKEFSQTAEALGMPATTALRVLITRFVEERGFPFDVKLSHSRLNWDDPRIIKTYRKDGKLMMPVAWRDEDEDDDE